MKNNDTFKITYTKQNGDEVERHGKWTDDCKEWICQKGYACLTYLDLDATEEHGKDQYRMATHTWSIK